MQLSEGIFISLRKALLCQVLFKIFILGNIYFRLFLRFVFFLFLYGLFCHLHEIGTDITVFLRSVISKGGIVPDIIVRTLFLAVNDEDISLHQLTHNCTRYRRFTHSYIITCHSPFFYDCHICFGIVFIIRLFFLGLAYFHKIGTYISGFALSVIFE